MQQKCCRAIFSPNSLTKKLQSHFPAKFIKKNQQQMDNAEILHFKFDSYKIWMQMIDVINFL